MVAVREARKAFQKYRVECFWSFRDVTAGLADVPWIIEQLRINGNFDALKTANRIKELLRPCR